MRTTPTLDTDLWMRLKELAEERPFPSRKS